MAPPTPARKSVKPPNPYLAETKRKKQQKSMQMSYGQTTTLKVWGVSPLDPSPVPMPRRVPARDARAALTQLVDSGYLARKPPGIIFLQQP
jgi:hypothetical protein